MKKKSFRDFLGQSIVSGEEFRKIFEKRRKSFGSLIKKHYFCTPNIKEGWQSGRLRWSRKPVYGSRIGGSNPPSSAEQSVELARKLCQGSQGSSMIIPLLPQSRARKQLSLSNERLFLFVDSTNPKLFVKKHTFLLDL